MRKLGEVLVSDRFLTPTRQSVVEGSLALHCEQFASSWNSNTD